jgi:spore germination cell wall hydrolase CwlJ-like protein
VPLTPWAPGKRPAALASGDPEIKQSAIVSPLKGDVDKAGTGVANKGKVTGVEQRPKSPGERLALAGEARAKAERCLANAVYFETRGEPGRGQIAVAQVEMNRVFSPFYPNDACDVLHQNANRHLACQFTFACDGISDVVTEPDAWQRARHIARDMLDGNLWMPEGAKFTRYHAYWVHPRWVAEMKKNVQARRAHLLSAEFMGRRIGRADLGRRQDHGWGSQKTVGGTWPCVSHARRKWLGSR